MADNIFVPHSRVQISCGNGRTKQSFKEETDINNVMKKWEATGVLPYQNRLKPEYGDFTNVPSYHAAVSQVKEAERLFAELPASIRDRFRNEPAGLLEFMADPENRQEAVDLGIIEAVDSTPAEVPPIPNNSLPPGTPETGGETPPD